MGYNKIITQNGTVLLDLTKTTVTPETLALGVTAIDSNGEIIVGISEGVKSGVTDVESLPIENIDPKKIYRVLSTVAEPMRAYVYNSPEGTGYYDDLTKKMIEQELGESVEVSLSIIEVDQLPDIGEPPVFSTDPFAITMTYYFLRKENKLYMCEEDGSFTAVGSEEAPFFGAISSETEATQTGLYLIEGSSYSVYHYWNYCDGQWIELVENIEVDEFPTENIRRDACYIKLVEGVKVYGIYQKDSWIVYSSGGGGVFLDFVSGAEQEEINIPEGVELIASYAFYKREYKRVFIPQTVVTIKENAFKDCALLEEIYYSGSEEDWNKITIEDGNEILIQANKNYDYVQNTN